VQKSTKASDPAVTAGARLVGALQTLERHLQKKGKDSFVTGKAATPLDGIIAADLIPIINAGALPVHMIAPTVYEFVQQVVALPWFKGGAALRASAHTVSGSKRKIEAVSTGTPASAGAGESSKPAAKPKEDDKPKGKKDAGTVDVVALKSMAPIDIKDDFRMRQPTVELVQEIFAASLLHAYPVASELGVQPDISVAAGKFAHHYQCNSALQLVSKLKGQPGAPANPRAAAEQLLKATEEIAKKIPGIGKLEIAGPGYINVYLAPDYLAARATYMLLNGIRPPPLAQQRRVVVDYSSPNIAKDMHIGHLRSTILGDCLARVLEFLGHDVMRVNHVGDWGTQFGMLIAHLKDLVAAGENTDVSIKDLTKFYKDAKKRFDAEPDFKERAHKEVVALQAGDPTNTLMWKRMIEVSQVMFDEGTIFCRDVPP
jgi:hypothetical protein